MKKQKREWYLLKIDGGLKTEVMVTVGPKKLLTTRECKEILDTFGE